MPYLYFFVGESKEIGMYTREMVERICSQDVDDVLNWIYGDEPRNEPREIFELLFEIFCDDRVALIVRANAQSAMQAIGYPTKSKEESEESWVGRLRERLVRAEKMTHSTEAVIVECARILCAGIDATLDAKQDDVR